MEQKFDSKAMGIAFMVMGIGMTVTLSTTLGPAFLGLGMPFIVLGIVFLGRAKQDGPSEGDK